MSSLSVITTSYNQDRTLRFLLASLERQTCLDFELIVADDGSSDGTAEFCRSYAPPFAGGFRFVTQADQGYRKSRILNTALREARGEYVIFLDSDVIVERHFIEDHLALRSRDAFVCGRRVELGPRFSATVKVEAVRSGIFDAPSASLLVSAMSEDTRNVKRAIRIPLRSVRRFLGYERNLDILGSNFGAWKADLVAINGFNEALEAYWGEDGDLFIRLRNSGKRAISALGLCIQHHVFHDRREPDPVMIKKYAELLGDPNYKWAEAGLVASKK